jgi:hypothetical protein
MRVDCAFRTRTDGKGKLDESARPFVEGAGLGASFPERLIGFE